MSDNGRTFLVSINHAALRGVRRHRLATRRSLRHWIETLPAHTKHFENHGHPMKLAQLRWSPGPKCIAIHALEPGDTGPRTGQ